VKSGGSGNRVYALLVLRDENDRLVLALHTGSDQLYVGGLFETSDTAGFSLTLRPVCRSSVDDGCFEHQTQAEFIGTFAGDDETSLHLLDPSGTLRIAGQPYSLQFSSSSVEGGEAICTNPDLAPARYLEFEVVATGG
jgi:hypothetical protein